MGMPLQFRDYPLLWYMVIVVCLVAAVHSAPSQAVELTFDRPCCVTTSCPVVTALAKLPTITELRHLTNTDGTKLFLRTAKAITPRELWSTVAAAHQPPRQMTINRETFTAGSFN